jgi:hypothetical protein
MRFDGEMDRRLQNWARWRIRRAEGGGIATASIVERVDGAGWDAPTVITTNDAEAEETEALVLRLESVLRYAVEVWYLNPGSVATRCKKAQASETEMRTRVARGQRLMGQALQDKRNAAHRERSRVEGLQRAGVLRSVGIP